jgi:hypothetical protein
MTPYARIVLVLVVALAAGVPAAAFQESVGEGDPMWVHLNVPEGVPALLNHDARVKGVRGNFDFWAYYAGDTETLNAFLADFSALEDTLFEVHFHVRALFVETQVRPESSKLEKRFLQDPGPEPPWETWATRRVSWWLVIRTNVEFRGGSWPPEYFRGHDWLAELHIHLDAGIRLGELAVPAHLPVRSAGELERFIAEHEACRARVTETEAEAEENADKQPRSPSAEESEPQTPE